MADDWVKMRVSLARDPKTVSAANYLGKHPGFLRWLANGNDHDCREATEYVGRTAIVLIVVGALVSIWGMARQRSKEDGTDLVLDCADLCSLDEIGGVPGLGDAMAYVGWVEEERVGEKVGEDVFRLRFANFLAEGSPYGAATSSAARKQKLYRERKKATGSNPEGNALRNALVTPRNIVGNEKVTVGNEGVTIVTTEREESKRREESKEEYPPTPQGGASKPRRRKQDATADDPGFEQFWEVFGNKKARQDAIAAWNRRRPDEDLLGVMLEAISRQRVAYGWGQPGGKIQPYPATWLNGRRWEDEIDSPRPHAPTAGNPARAEEEARRQERLRAIPVVDKPMSPQMAAYMARVHGYGAGAPRQDKEDTL